ncbi:MAG TPA: hypothetical protein PLJ27_04230 [Polyangiaceae bacterium]|nr:hypothetical protein [Polyangiaceae bacterium]HNZ21319.1 hypothetical protein [Polyangiaceae bacterium]HOD20996.1 hypothetical protein [Polyangiaceae bacterium]HOE47506.1 hypothetical protein [Polyangiaceae bacterium]HOG99499.1 hypothetical protein [Polyangiaceae bacterium]
MARPSMPPVSKRPRYLVVALIVAWTFGIGGIMNGCELLRFYKDPNTIPAQVHETTEEGLAGFLAAQQRISKEASTKALEEHQQRMVPLAVANILLSALLIVACARALAAKRNAHHLALQAVAANILYAIVDYFVSAPVRHAVLTATTSQTLPADAHELDPTQLASAVAWSVRILSAMHVAILGLVAFALTRPRTLAFFHGVEEISPPEEP